MNGEIQDEVLLRSFVQDDSQRAFAALAQRYAGLVFHVGMRFSGSAELAEEAAQNTFVILAKKAARLDASRGLGAWLHRTAYFEASKLRDRELRYREQVRRFADTGAPDSNSAPGDVALVPALDRALSELRDADRRVILLRYYDGYSAEELAKLHGQKPATWRKRSSRAIGRLRARLARRGVSVSSASLVAGLSLWLPKPVHAGVVESLAGAADGAGAAAGLGTATGGVLGLCLAPSLKGIAVCVALLLLGGLVIHGLVSSGSGRSPEPGGGVATPNRLSSITKRLPAGSASRGGGEVRRFDEEEQQAWLQAFREHLNAPGPPHGNRIFEAIGGLGVTRGEGYGGLGRSPVHQFIDRAGGDASGVLEVLTEGLESDRATVAYRALGMWGWVREYAQEDGAETLLNFAAQTEVRSLAMYALNILGQYHDYRPDDLPARLIEQLKEGSDQLKIALSYYGGGFVSNGWLGEEFEGELSPLLERGEPLTRFAVARILADQAGGDSREVMAGLLEIPAYLEDYHFERTLAQIVEMPVTAAESNHSALASTLGGMRDRLGDEPAFYRALIRFDLAGDEEATFLRWQEEASALQARSGDESLTVGELIGAMDNPIARPFAIGQIRRIGPNAVAYREQLIAMLEESPDDRKLAEAAHATDINRPHPYPWVSMRGMYAALRPVDEALAASDDPDWIQFRRDLDVWMIDEPHTDVRAARGLAEDLAGLSPELRDLFVDSMRENLGELAGLAFGEEGEPAAPPSRAR